MHQAIADVLEEEVSELLGRARSQRRQALNVPAGYRNGYGKPRQLTLSCGTIEVRRPRVPGLEERFESRILPLFVKRSLQVDAVLSQLYLHGLAERDFDLALRGQARALVMHEVACVLREGNLDIGEVVVKDISPIRLEDRIVAPPENARRDVYPRRPLRSACHNG